MSRELTYTAIILKKQAFKESDEIVTLFTKEQGKVRVLAKAIKSSKSKLQQRLQVLFLGQLIVTGGKMPQIISSEPLEVFVGLRERLPAIKMAYYAIELALKFTGDEHKNERLFDLLLDFFRFLDKHQDKEGLNLALAKFKIEILEVSGLSVPNRSDEPFLQIKKTSFTEIPNLKIKSDLVSLQDFLSQFIEHHLEREVKSENYLKQ